MHDAIRQAGLLYQQLLSRITRMSTVAEIEAAIEQLPTQQMLEVAGWLDERRGILLASEGLFQRLDAEEGEAAGNQWLGE
ncbi:MAG: hypothetical protein RLZZ399_2148 [Verrucomicrobiota bacterium]